MDIGRRGFIGGIMAVGACSPSARNSRDAFVAGQPAALLVLALAPERMIGWPRRPSPEAIRLLPGSDLPQTGAIAGGGAPASLESVAASRPQLIIDYGDVDPRYRDLAKRIEQRLGVPYRLIDGALRKTPAAIAEAGAILGRPDRGNRLADAASGVLDRWSSPGRSGPSFYYARGNDGLETGFAGSLATEVLEGAGWTNVARGAHGIKRVSQEQFAAWDPEVLVTLDAKVARQALDDPFYRSRRSGSARRILLVPDLPFGWIDRPPSINRLLGCAWFASSVGGALDAAKLASLLWSVAADRAAAVMPEWLN